MSFPAQYAYANVAAGSTDATFTKADGTGNPLIAVTGYQIRVVSVSAVCAATATTLTFNSKGAGAGTPISATFPNGANAGFVWNENTAGWTATNSGETLTVTTGAGSTTAIQLVYRLVPL